MKPSQTMQSNQSMSQTMYNLHTKRTLPRDVIKWMQGLDLSYSVKDYRKDMSNGFLIGEIVSRYQPGRIPMHSFENSSNQVKRDNNWSQLELFFSKFTLRGIQVSSDYFDKIKANQDTKSQQLFTFICHLYSICTKRTIQQSPPALDLPPTQNPNPNLTTSYLLKDQGLQKLQNSNLQSVNNHSLQNSGLSQKIQDRIPTRKIATNVESGDLVDATGMGIKAEGRKITAKKKSWNNFDQLNEQTGEQDENHQPDRLIFDYLSSIMEECLPTEDPTIRELLFPDIDKLTPTQLLLRNIQAVQPQYMFQFLSQVSLNVEELSGVILREINQTWKFFTYFFKLLRPLADNPQLFALLSQLIVNYARTCHSREPKRLSKVFYDALLPQLINEIKLVNNLRKKFHLMHLIYDFAGRETQHKKAALSKIKDLIGSSNVLYIQWLSILVQQQVSSKDSPLLDDFIYYAQQYLTSSQVAARTAALRILAEISKSHPSLISKFFVSKTMVYRNSKDDPEQVYLLIEIYFNIMKEVVESPMYQSLVKGVGSNNLVKAYNPDNQKNAQQLKLKVNTLAQTIKQLCQVSANSSLRQICSKRAIPFIHQSRHMMQVFLQYIYASNSNEKTDFFSVNKSQHEFKSFNVEVPVVNISEVKEHCNQILVEIVSLKTTKGYVVEEFVQLINLCLENLNVKRINMEFWQDVSLHIVKPYTKLLTDPTFSKQAVQGLIRVFAIYFSFDMKIRQLTQWIAQSINNFQQLNNNDSTAQLQNKEEVNTYIKQSIGELNDWLNNEYHKTRNQVVTFVIREITDFLNAPKQQKLVYFKH